MRLVLAGLLAAVLVLFGLSATAAAPSPFAQQRDQQDPVEEERDATPEDEEEEEQEGVGSEDDEEDAGAGAGEEEEGPPWTYQMAWLSLAALAGLGLAVGAAYYRFVILRRRGYV